MVVDFGSGSGFMAVDFGLFCGGLWVNGGVAGFCLSFVVAGFRRHASPLWVDCGRGLMGFVFYFVFDGGSWSWSGLLDFVFDFFSS